MPNLPILVIGEKRANVGDFPGSEVAFIKRPVSAEDLLSTVRTMLSDWTRGQLKTA